MNAPAILLVALTACTQTHPSQKPTQPLPGQHVTKIDQRIWCIHQTQNGDYWFGSNGNGAYRFDGKTVTHYGEEQGLNGLQVRGLHEDARGRVLIATNRGVSRFDGASLTTLELVVEPTPPEDWVLKVDDLWLVVPPVPGPVRYDGEKLYHMQPSESPVLASRHRESPPFSWDPAAVFSVYKDRRGHIWIGTADVGLCRYDGKTLSWMFEEHLTTTPSGGAFGIRSIYEDRHGHFWICNTRNRFVISPDPKQVGEHHLIQHEKRPGLPNAAADADDNSMFYPSMVEDDAGALWMACCNKGVWSYRDEGVTKYALPADAYACCIVCDQQGKLWVGTIEHGIFVFDGEGFQPFEVAQLR